MTPDPIDRLGARLFDAARKEQPPAGAEQRLLAAALRETRESERARPTPLRRSITLGAVATAVLLAAGVALQLTRQKPSDRISAEPARPRSAAQKAPVSEAAPSASTRPAPTAPPSSVRPQLTAPLPSAAAAVTLSDELAALKVASTALNAGDTQAALAALDGYDHVLKGSKLRAEATLLRIQALARAGDAPGASALAQRFVDQNPDSPLVDRARSFIQTTGLGGN